jgi:hypothetical protein
LGTSFGSAYVIGMLMAEHHRRQAPAAGVLNVKQVEQPALFTLFASAWIEQVDRAGTNQIGIGVGARR